jgi:hypothetical protein
VFISYRRKTGVDRARIIQEFLDQNGCEVFLDMASLEAGPYEEPILESIRNCTHFILVLFPTDLDRCKGDEKLKDWLHKVKVIHRLCTYVYALCDTIWGRLISDKPGNCRGTQE